MISRACSFWYHWEFQEDERKKKERNMGIWREHDRSSSFPTRLGGNCDCMSFLQACCSLQALGRGKGRCGDMRSKFRKKKKGIGHVFSKFQRSLGIRLINLPLLTPLPPCSGRGNGQRIPTRKKKLFSFHSFFFFDPLYLCDELCLAEVLLDIISLARPPHTHKNEILLLKLKYVFWQHKFFFLPVI